MKPVTLITICLFFCNLLNYTLSAQNHRVRIQVQGDDIGSGISLTWEKDFIMTKQEGVELLNKLWDQLSPSQKKEREDAYTRARNYISDSPVRGRSDQGSKSFQQDNRRISNARIDVEINRGAAFSNDRHVVYIRFVGNDFSSNPVWSYDNKYIPTKNQALDEIERMWRNCSNEQKTVREDAYRKAVDFIKSCDSNGREGSGSIHEFTDSRARNGEKIVITIDRGAAFSN
ncbi:MAG: hypothetical protein IT270_07485 [Saprospiraceae bacterium]|nr:hypothetical protein [Saprospiraceae bacterium]